MTGRPARRPNIVFVMADDHAASAIGAYGDAPNATPSIDRLAAEGARHDRCYVSNSICTPSRAAILQGTYNHVNGVTTLDTPMPNRLPNVAKLLRAGGYRTGMIGKWHLGEGPEHEPRGFDEWCVLPGQGEYFDPPMIGPDGVRTMPGYATDVITDLALDFVDRSVGDGAGERPFFLMCHHKAPHRPFRPHPRHRHLWRDEDLPVPPTFHDDYRGRAGAAEAARMRVRRDMTYEDLGLVQPEGGAEVGELLFDGSDVRFVPDIRPGETIELIDAASGERHRFDDPDALARFKLQRYLRRYLQTVQAIDEGMGRLLDRLDERGIANDTLVIYTSDQGFFLGEHGWFDKRFMYEESWRMPFLARLPSAIPAGTVATRLASNVDFASTFLDYAGLAVPSFMQGRSLRDDLEGRGRPQDDDVAYHRYWMHDDVFHHAWAHYGVRDRRHKLVYWYNDALDQPGARSNGAPPEWELFDCESDPHELRNLAGDPAQHDTFRRMLTLLDRHMATIGDVPEHDSRAVLRDFEAAGA